MDAALGQYHPHWYYSPAVQYLLYELYTHVYIDARNANTHIYTSTYLHNYPLTQLCIHTYTHLSTYTYRIQHSNKTTHVHVYTLHIYKCMYPHLLSHC